ncbi:MAG: hypothetical protein ACI86L_001197 [Dokdonia sp.]|jgi:hypothetical protein
MCNKQREYWECMSWYKTLLSLLIASCKPIFLITMSKKNKESKLTKVIFKKKHHW